MLRFLETFPRQDALALFMNLQHMELRLLPRPPKNGLKNVRDIIHEIDRIIPANDQIPRLQAGFRLLFCLLDSAWQQLWNVGLCHPPKLKEARSLVESLGEEPDCPAARKRAESRQECHAPRRVGTPKSLNIQGCNPSNMWYD